jgi:hypothetical protein
VFITITIESQIESLISNFFKCALKELAKSLMKNCTMEHHFWQWQQLYQSNKAPIKKTCSCQGQLELGFWQKKAMRSHPC